MVLDQEVLHISLPGSLLMAKGAWRRLLPAVVPFLVAPSAGVTLVLCRPAGRRANATDQAALLGLVSSAPYGGAHLSPP